jgi:hypothetical protein
MWEGLQRVRWNVRYPGGCTAAPAHQNLRYGLYGHAYLCAAETGHVVAESFYFPVDGDPPSLLLRRADFRLATDYPPMSAEVERLLAERLTRAYGAGAVPESLFEIGANRPNPGLTWRAGGLTIFLHRNRNYVAPAGIRFGVQLIAVRQEVLDEREVHREIGEAIPSYIPEDLLMQELGTLYPPPGSATLPALLEILAQAGSASPGRNALLFTAADSLVVRLGGELVTRTHGAGGEMVMESPETVEVHRRLKPYGVHYLGIGKYSEVLEYDRSLLVKAWTGYQATVWGQRALLELQRLSCARFGEACGGPNCFLEVIRLGERFLAENPDTPLRLEQTFHLALAHETWWSLSQATEDSPSSGSVKMDEVSGEAARLRAIALYEEVERLARGSRQARLGQIALPRLRLRIDTGQRAFFCGSC